MSHQIRIEATSNFEKIKNKTKNKKTGVIGVFTRSKLKSSKNILRRNFKG